MRTFKAAQADHLTNLAALGWAVRTDLKVPHATNPDGVRIWFKAQSCHAARGTDMGAARSLNVDPRTVRTVDLAVAAVDLAAFLAGPF